MKTYSKVSRKSIEEDRVAICPNFGCEYMKRIKPLKFRFLGFGKYPKCKEHHIPLVFINERVGDFVDAALACFFDKSALPPFELLDNIISKFPDEITSFINGWVYCITIGRGAPIVSRYLDTISNTYLKQLTRKQIKSFKIGNSSRPNLVNKAIKDGMDEISNQYTRLLKHLKAHSEIIIEHQKIKPLSKGLRNYLNGWQNSILNRKETLKISEFGMSLKEIKLKYDQILNVGICKCLLGLNPKNNIFNKIKLTAFDRYSAYDNFLSEGITEKFTKSDIKSLYLDVERSRDNRSNSRQIGDYSEIKLIESLIKAGKKVLIPFGDTQSFDLLFEENSKIYPVQVKTTNIKGFFPIRSNKKEYDNITHFGIYSREEKHSYLIPTNILNAKNSTKVKLRDDLKNKFKIEEIGYKDDSVISIERCSRMMKEGKLILCQLDSGIENMVFYDESEDMTQKVNSIDISNVKNNSYHCLYPLNIVADLMAVGFIVSRPILFDSNYDFVIKNEYNLNRKLIQDGFQKVKIIQNYDNIEKYRGYVDFFAIYNEDNGKSYLIPNNDVMGKDDKFLLNRQKNIMKEMSANDLGDAMELRIGAEFEKYNYRVFYPLIGRQIFDIIFENDNRYYKVQVKTGRKYKEKDSLYFRFDTSTILNQSRKTYKGKVDFMCAVDRDTLKSYIVPINKVPQIGVKLKLDNRQDARYIHHGTLWADDYEFSMVDKIIKNYQIEKNSRLSIGNLYDNVPSSKIEFERNKILKILQGTENIRDHFNINSELQALIIKFKDLKKGRIEYQGVLSVGFRDFLIEQPSMKSFIEEKMKGNKYFSIDEDKHDKFYKYIKEFLVVNERSPTTLELYYNFLNFKSYELRSKMRVIQKNNPKYYQK